MGEESRGGLAASDVSMTIMAGAGFTAAGSHQSMVITVAVLLGCAGLVFLSKLFAYIMTAYINDRPTDQQ